MNFDELVAAIDRLTRAVESLAQATQENPRQGLRDTRPIEHFFSWRWQGKTLRRQLAIRGIRTVSEAEAVIATGDVVSRWPGCGPVTERILIEAIDKAKASR